VYAELLRDLIRAASGRGRRVHFNNTFPLISPAGVLRGKAARRAGGAGACETNLHVLLKRDDAARRPYL
jgi:hypothetical protein